MTGAMRHWGYFKNAEPTAGDETRDLDKNGCGLRCRLAARHPQRQGTADEWGERAARARDRRRQCHRSATTGGRSAVHEFLKKPPDDPRTLVAHITQKIPDRAKCLNVFLAMLIDDPRLYRKVAEFAFDA
jgi:hypothetical protein